MMREPICQFLLSCFGMIKNRDILLVLQQMPAGILRLPCQHLTFCTTTNNGSMYCRCNNWYISKRKRIEHPPIRLSLHYHVAWTIGIAIFAWLRHQRTIVLVSGFELDLHTIATCCLASRALLLVQQFNASSSPPLRQYHPRMQLSKAPRLPIICYCCSKSMPLTC